MTTPYVLSTLVAKRAEIAGAITELERQLAQHRADLIHLDGVLRLLDSGIDPETIKPKRPYRRTRYFGRYELSRFCLAALRTASEPLSTDDIAGQVIAAKGFQADDAILRAAVRLQVKTVAQRLRREGTIENIGKRSASKWKLAGA
jgi:hypothetical protein